MSVEHHDLLHDFPEYKERIHELKISNTHFRKLFDEYHHLTREVENMENEVEMVTTNVEKTAKLHRVHLKDQLYAMIIQS